MGRHFVGEIFAVGSDSAFSHQRFTDNQCGTLRFIVGRCQCFAYLVGVIAVYGDDVPSPGLVFLCCIFGCHLFHCCGELDVVGIIEHNQIGESQRSGDTSGALRDFFLYASIGNESIGFVSHPFPKTCH